MRTIAAPAALALALLTGACGADGDPPAAPTATASPVHEPGAPPFAAGTRAEDGGPGSGNGLAVVGVRTASRPGYDRVVFDLGGTGTPGWRVEYVTDPVHDGSGEPVSLKGAAYLAVTLRGLGLPSDTGLGQYGDDTTRVPGAGTTGITEIAPGGVFEGDQQAFIGLTGDRRPFRAFALADPTRLVVDVREP